MPGAGLLLPNVVGLGLCEAGWCQLGCPMGAFSPWDVGTGSGRVPGGLPAAGGIPQPQPSALSCSSDEYLSTEPSWVLSVKLVIAVQSKDRLMYTSPWQRLDKSLREAPGCILWAVAFFWLVRMWAFSPTLARGAGNTRAGLITFPAACFRKSLPCVDFLTF